MLYQGLTSALPIELLKLESRLSDTFGVGARNTLLK